MEDPQQVSLQANEGYCQLLYSVVYSQGGQNLKRTYTQTAKISVYDFLGQRYVQGNLEKVIYPIW